MATEPNKIIYSMVGVSKFYDKRAVLKNIYLSYFYGAKIGVIGLNGSGKSSLLRIMAGVDREINGEAVLSPGYTVGCKRILPSNQWYRALAPPNGEPLTGGGPLTLTARLQRRF